jgi:hypothetical protein
MLRLGDPDFHFEPAGRESYAHVGEVACGRELPKPGSGKLESEDRTELNSLAGRERERVDELVKLYGAWAERCGVLPWPLRAGEYMLRMRGQHIHLSYHRGRQFYP